MHISFLLRKLKCGNFCSFQKPGFLLATSLESVPNSRYTISFLRTKSPSVVGSIFPHPEIISILVLESTVNILAKTNLQNNKKTYLKCRYQGK